MTGNDNFAMSSSHQDGTKLGVNTASEQTGEDEACDRPGRDNLDVIDDAIAGITDDDIEKRLLAVIHNVGYASRRDPAPAVQLELEYQVTADGAATVHVRGELDIGIADQAYAYLRDVIGSQAGPVTLNLAGLIFCNATGLGILARLAGQAMRSGRPLRLMDVPPSLLRIMRVTGMDKAFPGMSVLVTRHDRLALAAAVATSG